MWHLPTRPATRWAAGAALIFTALAVPAFAAGPASAAPVDQTPGQVTVGPGCPMVSSFIDDWDTNLTWSQAGGDYTGQDADPLDPAGHFEGNCDGTSIYMLDQPTETDQFSWHLTTDLWDSLGHGLSCHLWAYIPSQFAGDRNARYDFWADNELGHRGWLGWPGHTIDQEATSGWTDLGGVEVPAFTNMITVTLSNQDSQDPGWYVGAGDLAATCTVDPGVPN